MALVQEILETTGLEGITLTGGEPFEQAEALAELAMHIRRAGLSVMAFTGFKLEELCQPEQRALLNLCDIVVAGRYVQALRTEYLTWRGSSNQTVHILSKHYDASVMDETDVCEVHINATGEMIVTGFPPANLFKL